MHHRHQRIDHNDPARQVNEAIPERASRAGSAARGRHLGLRSAAAEITIRSLLATLAHGWWLLLAAIVLALLVTTVALKLQSPLYSATMIVAPAPTDLTAASQLASELEQFASLATLAQSPAKIERVSDLERYLQLFGSTALAARLQAEHQLLQIVFENDWDAEQQAWRRPSGLRALIEHAVLGFFGFPSWTEPDIATLAEWLDGRVQVTRMGGSAMLRLRMQHAQPEFAAQIVRAGPRDCRPTAARERARADRRADRAGRARARRGARADPPRRRSRPAAPAVPGPGAAPGRPALRRADPGAGDRERRRRPRPTRCWCWCWRRWSARSSASS